ncbi:MAG: hypothetical protein ACE5JX_08035 [Acidobacteriota bacterium]
MLYRIKIAGKIFEGCDTRKLVRLAVAARRAEREKGVVAHPSEIWATAGPVRPLGNLSGSNSSQGFVMGSRNPDSDRARRSATHSAQTTSPME